MTNSKWKKVWHVWDKDVLPSDAVRLKLSNSWTIDAKDKMVKSVLDDRFDTTIIAYTTGQMRRRVECDFCLGHGRHFDPEGDDHLSCPDCNGKGYQWENKNNG